MSVSTRQFTQEKSMPKKQRRRAHKHRTPWPDAIREVPAAWLEDKAKRSPSPSSLLSSWKGGRGGVPAHVMLEMLRRRIRDCYPALLRSVPPAAELHRAENIIRTLWAATGRASRSNPTWRAVMGVLVLAQQQIAARAEMNQDRPDPQARPSEESATANLTKEPKKEIQDAEKHTI